MLAVTVPLSALAAATPTPTPAPASTPADPSTLDDAWSWITGGPLHIGLIVIVALVSRWLAHRLINGVVRTMTADGRAHERPGADRRVVAGGRTSLQLLTERRRQRAETMGSLLRSVCSVVIFGLAFVLVLGELGINLGPIVATAGIAGVALGFGAQSLVKDFLSGVFMILEDQYGVGDVIDTGFAIGEVEEVALRVTQIRDVNGVVWYVRNGEIMRIGNRSQGWSLATLDIPVAFDSDLDRVREVVAEVGARMLDADPRRERVLEAPSVVGVESVTGDSIVVRITARAAPQQSLPVTRELREAVKDAFDRAGIRVPVPTRPAGGSASPTSTAT